MKKVLIIGGCGYLGTKLYPYLIQKGYLVTSIDLEWFGMFHDNICEDFRDTSSDFINSFDVVVNLAGHSSVPSCSGNPMHSLKNNVENYVDLFNRIKTRLIYASSSSVYNGSKSTQVSEDYDVFVPKNCYDLSKKVVDFYAKLSNVEYYSLRFGTLAGSAPNLRSDVIINKLYETAINQKCIYTKNNHVNRPILSVNDAVRAIERIIECEEDRRGIYNLASFNTTVETLGTLTAIALNVPRYLLPDDESTYDFSICTKKFENTFNFSFKDNFTTIIEDLKENYNKCASSVRDKDVKYERN